MASISPEPFQTAVEPTSVADLRQLFEPAMEKPMREKGVMQGLTQGRNVRRN